MKLSEALRRADELELPDLRATFVEVFIEQWDGEKPPCCAIGGANCVAGLTVLETVNSPYGPFLTQRSLDSFGWREYLSENRVGIPCPACSFPYILLLPGTIMHLYDTHGWSRTRIAAWIEQAGLDVDMPEPNV